MLMFIFVRLSLSKPSDPGPSFDKLRMSFDKLRMTFDKLRMTFDKLGMTLDNVIISVRKSFALVSGQLYGSSVETKKKAIFKSGL